MKKTIAALGLVGLLGGCDKTLTWIKDECTMGGLTLKAEYVSKSLDPDHCNLLIYKGDQILGRIDRIYKAEPEFICDNKRVFDKDTCTFSYQP